MVVPTVYSSRVLDTMVSGSRGKRFLSLFGNTDFAWADNSADKQLSMPPGLLGFPTY